MIFNCHVIYYYMSDHQTGSNHWDMTIFKDTTVSEIAETFDRWT